MRYIRLYGMTAYQSGLAGPKSTYLAKRPPGLAGPSIERLRTCLFLVSSSAKYDLYCYYDGYFVTAHLLICVCWLISADRS